MERKSLVAIALCIVLILFWQPLMRMAGLGRYLDAPRRPGPTATAPERPGERATPAPTDSAPTAAAGAIAGAPAAAPAPPVTFQPATIASEHIYVVDTPLYRATFTNRGARLMSVELKHYAAAYDSFGAASAPHPHGREVPAGHRVMLVGEPVFGIELGSGATRRPLDAVVYEVAESTDAAGAIRGLTFTTRDSAGASVRQTWRVRPQDYALDLEVAVTGVPSGWRLDDYALTMRSWPEVTEHDLVADARMLRASAMLGKNVRREAARSLLKGPKRLDGSVQWAGVQTRYFVALTAVQHGIARGVEEVAEMRTLDPAELKLLPSGSHAEQPLVVNRLIMGLSAPGAAADRFVVYVGPSEYHRLAALKLQLERVVDMGWNWLLPVSTLLLQGLNALYRLLPNFGIAILLLATLVRLLLHPLNMTSIKSMRAMQRLQPEIERVREKYKDDAQAMNTAMMALYKENKVNPAGGCLPMLLQMPLFLALYQVLFNAIELRQAPFVAWINDLSAPDVLLPIPGSPWPLRLLPLLMAGSGFLTQKMTPTDPRQAPTMYMMNIMMLVFFYNLPSGLVLYWTWMNVLTAVQQWLALRTDSGVSMAVVVEEERGGSKRRGKGR